jgi:LPXTG-site transpeptidase (sortase) family protein
MPAGAATAPAEASAMATAPDRAEASAAATAQFQAGGVASADPAASPSEAARSEAARSEAARSEAAPSEAAPSEAGSAVVPAQRAAPIVPAEVEPKPQKGPAPQGLREQVLRGTGVALLLLSVFVLGFAAYLYGLSGVQEARSQSVLYQQLQVELANQVAPLGSAATTAAAPAASAGISLAAPGAPVAILRIPAIGVRDMVVVEGTSPEDLTLGPGHMRDSPLPGQAGVSEILGRVSTFGAPFARLAQLQSGDVIQVVTGQGTSTYRVAAIGNSSYVVNDPAPNRLVLLTASSPTVPTYYIDVDARLTSQVQNGPAVPQVISAPELPLAGDGGALGLIMAWGLALALVAAGGTVAAARWSPWPAYLAAAPVLLAVLWNLYQGLAALLPNVY